MSAPRKIHLRGIMCGSPSVNRKFGRLPQVTCRACRKLHESRKLGPPTAAGLVACMAMVACGRTILRSHDGVVWLVRTHVAHGGADYGERFALRLGGRSWRYDVRTAAVHAYHLSAGNLEVRV